MGSYNLTVLDIWSEGAHSKQNLMRESTPKTAHRDTATAALFHA